MTCSIGVIPLEPGVYIGSVPERGSSALRGEEEGKNQVAFGYRYLEAGKKAEEEQEIGQ